jgi:hypothetical protein
MDSVVFAWRVCDSANPVIAPKNRNCTPTPASATQYAIASAQVAAMTAQFFSGLGSSGQTFPISSATSQVMAQSAGVQNVLNEYYMTGTTNDNYNFGWVGLQSSGANPVAQFVGSFSWTISQGNGGIYLQLRNRTSFRSLTYDRGPQWARGSFLTPMGNTYQIYNIFVPCKAS